MIDGVMRRADRPGAARKDLIALLTHDVRTPLAVISGNASELQDRWDELPDGEKYARVAAIARNGARLEHMVEDGLRALLAGAEETVCEIAPFDLGVQVRDVVADFSDMAPNDFMVRLDDALPPVLGDERFNWHALTNLVSNAVKFSPPGEPIEVAAVRRDDDAVLTVRDHGIGIAARDVTKLFRPFGRVHRAGERTRPGIGLGLHLTKQIVEAQGGRIWVDSAPGRGSAFTYTLPLAGA